MMPNILFTFASFFFLFFKTPSCYSEPFACSENFLLHSHGECSGFVYQNIDLFSLYTSTFCSASWSVSSRLHPGGLPLTGHLFLDVDLPMKQSLAASGTRERWGSRYLEESSCALLAVLAFCVTGQGNTHLIGPFQNKTISR